MEFYCGLDLSARDCYVCVIDDNLSILVQEKVKNELPRVIALIEPFRENLQIVVESTFNWYWLVDGLQEQGFDVCLAHTLGLYMITGAKVKTDRRDAFALAKLLKAGVIPKAYIYPKGTRPTRDLLRRRSNLVQHRAEEYGSLRRLLLREGILDHSRNDIKHTVEEDLKEWFQHPMIELHARFQLERIDLFTQQITELESTILATAKKRPEYKLLITVPGIWKILAMTIMYEVGEIARFEDARHFSSYCRVVPGVAQSGSSSRRGRGSKQGNPYLKCAFSQAATFAVRYYPNIRRCFDRQLSRHRGRARKLIAYNIIAHKIAQAVYRVLRDETKYREDLMFDN
jgi:transposase